jgi:hypothetical protein
MMGHVVAHEFAQLRPRHRELPAEDGDLFHGFVVVERGDGFFGILERAFQKGEHALLGSLAFELGFCRWLSPSGKGGEEIVGAANVGHEFAEGAHFF